jgi:hypothetical protein
MSTMILLTTSYRQMNQSLRRRQRQSENGEDEQSCHSSGLSCHQVLTEYYWHYSSYRQMNQSLRRRERLKKRTDLNLQRWRVGLFRMSIPSSKITIRRLRRRSGRRSQGRDNLRTAKMNRAATRALATMASRALQDELNNANNTQSVPGGNSVRSSGSSSSGDRTWSIRSSYSFHTSSSVGGEPGIGGTAVTKTEEEDRFELATMASRALQDELNNANNTQSVPGVVNKIIVLIPHLVFSWRGTWNRGYSCNGSQSPRAIRNDGE